MDSCQLQQKRIRSKRTRMKDNSFNMNEKFKQYLPPHLPFEASRLARAEETFALNRGQIMDIHGGYVLTNPDLLPSGGGHYNLNIDTETLDLFLLGDMGRANLERQKVIKHISDLCLLNTQNKTSNLLFGLGDWMYPYGTIDHSSEEHIRAQETILDAMEPLAQKHSFYGILGNHEYGDTSQGAVPEIFMNYAQRQGIQFPERYYTLEVKAKTWIMDCFALDTSTLACDATQVQWLHAQVKQSLKKESETGQRRWRVIMGHHPIISYGFHFEENEFFIELLNNALKEIDLYCAGHEHDMQFIKPSNTNLPPIIVSGTISESRMTWEGPDSILSSSNHGFAKVEVSKSGLCVEFHETKNHKRLFNSKVAS
ncbi:MAG: metallophosphoesterase [Pseudomonadota bacterium]|nr:metallophosphoesterase [Pseudomonadota bacterium]